MIHQNRREITKSESNIELNGGGFVNIVDIVRDFYSLNFQIVSYNNINILKAWFDWHDIFSFCNHLLISN